MAEKIRYYLEQSVPELEDLKRKGLFDKNEITMIMRRRTDFEHRIQGRGCKSRDFLKYSEFESNVDKLRKKRYRRLAKVGLIDTKPSLSDWAGTRRVLFIFERAARRFPGDMELWSNYLKFAKGYGAIKVVYKVYSRLLQLQPRNIDAWLSAAKYEFETNANSKGARQLFQKGLRLNPDSFTLWLAYAQFELTYVSKLLARRKVLGLLNEKDQKKDISDQEKKLQKEKDASKIDKDFDDDVIELPGDEEIKDELKHLPEADINMLGNPETNPALRGDVALTIFDLSLPNVLKTTYGTLGEERKIEKAFGMVESFLQLFDQFEDLNRDHLYLHVLNYVQTNYPNDIRTVLIDITLPLRTLSPNAEGFSGELQLSVNKFFAYRTKIFDDRKSLLTNKFVEYLNERFIQNVDDKPSERTTEILKAIIKKCQAA